MKNRKSFRELIPNNFAAVKSTFSSLSSRNYRIYFFGQCVSLTGTWMQQIAMSWLIYRLTGSVVLLGVVNFLTQAPGFFLSPFAGVICNRFRLLRILLTTQTLLGIQASILTILVLTNTVEVWHILSLSLIIGIINSMDMPTRQVLVINLVDKKENLNNAIALNSATFNGARLVGPSVAGVLIALTGEGICFLINAISYLGVIVALCQIKITEEMKQSSKNVFSEIHEGFRYVSGFLPIRTLLLLLGFFSFFGVTFITVMPAFAKDVVGGDSATLGFMMGSLGLGAFLAALYLAARKSVLGLGKVVSISVILFGVSLGVFSFLRIDFLNYFMLLFTGFGMVATITSANTLLQTLTTEKMRSRVLSFYAMALGLTPFGNLLIGFVAKWIGIPYTFVICGFLCVVAGLVFEHYRPIVRRMARPVYVEKGIMIPEIAESLESSSDIQ